ncbi:MAG TPA: class I SAM-dependent methyltransferase [Gemmatimonadota bacterium]|nr:class I SAM-dependent methyltransferase [Gemmatimonadota bacterium]
MDQPISNDERVRRVAEAYDRVAERYAEARGTVAGPFRRLLDRLVQPLPDGATILDVGCGHGVPARYLVERGFRLTGLDASTRLTALAREAVPEADFIRGDMRTADPGGPFDAILAWDSVFHVPRNDHAAVFAKFRSWIEPGGRLLVSLGGSGPEDFTSEMLGETFFYSGHAPEAALVIIQDAGFEIEHWEVDDPSSRGHVAVLGKAGPISGHSSERGCTDEELGVAGVS